MGRDSEKGKYASPEGSHLWEYIVTIICALEGITIGATLGWTSPALAELASPDLPNHISPEEASTIAGAMAIGSLPAPLISLFIIDRLGRQKTILASCVPFALSWGLILASQETWVLILARAMAGLATGLYTFTLPIYMGEILSTNLRGLLMTVPIITFSSGLTFMMSVGPYFGTQVMSGFSFAISICCLVGFWFAPESPYFLVAVGRVEEAETTLIKIRGKTDAADEIELIKATLCKKSETLLGSSEAGNKVEEEKESVFKQIFAVRGNRKAFGIVMLIYTLRHSSGLGSVFSYCEIIFGAMGANIDVRRASMIFGVMQTISALLTFVIIEKFNRKTLILSCGAATSFLLFVIGTYFFLIEYTTLDVKQYHFIPYFSVYVYLVVVNVGILAVPGVINSEILAPNVKGPIFCICGITEAFIGFGVAKFYLLSATTWGLGHSIPLFTYAFLTWISIAAVMWLLPETRGKTLLDIQKSLNA